MNKLRLKYSKNNNNEDDDNCIINDNNNHIDGERGEIKQKMKKKQNQNNYYKKYQITHKMYNLIYVIALVTLSMNIVSIVPLSDAALHEKNITRLTDVEPPATSSLQDRMSTIYAISPTSRSLKQGANNCTFIHENQLKNDKIKGKDSTESDSSDFSASIEDLPDDSNFDVSSHYLGKVPVLGDPDESFRRVSTCQTCNRSHDDIIEASLKSIHDLVLLKLGFSTPPNMTNKAAIPKIPQKIVDGFLKQHYTNKQHPVYGKGRHDNMDQDMQGDDPNVMEKYYDNYPKEIYEEEDDDYFPITERVYVFSKTPKLRHQSKHRTQSDVLQFHFDNVKHSQVSRAILHVFVHSEHWLAEHDSSTKYEKNFNLTIHKVKRNAKSYQQLVNYHEGHIPKTKGHYMSVDVTQMVDEWYRNPSSNYGLVIKVNGQNGHKLIVINSGDRDHAPYIEMFLEDTRKRRTKRSLSLTCRKQDNEKRCCRYPLMVDFRKFDWDWIIAPNDYMANYCAGECTITFLSKYMHTHVWQLSTSATPCCSPTKMAPLVLLYYDTNYNVVQSTIPNMIVEKCSCS